MSFKHHLCHHRYSLYLRDCSKHLQIKCYLLNQVSLYLQNYLFHLHLKLCIHLRWNHGPILPTNVAPYSTFTHSYISILVFSYNHSSVFIFISIYIYITLWIYSLFFVISASSTSMPFLIFYMQCSRVKTTGSYYIVITLLILLTLLFIFAIGILIIPLRSLFKS